MTLDAVSNNSWVPRKIWNCFEIVNGATPASGTEHYWDGDVCWVGPADLGKLSSRFITRGDRNLTEAGYNSCGTTIVPKGTIILSARAPIGHVAIAGNELCFNQGCKGLVPNNDVTGEYAYWLVLALKPHLEAAGQGTTFIELSRSKLKDVEFLLPPRPEQRAIAAFLDEKCAKLDEAVRIKEEQIALLRERRQILIQQAVTRGLNPSAPMKDSGIDWIGQIPAHWERRKVRHLFSIGRGRVIPKDELVEDGLYPVYSSQTKNDGIFGYLNSYDFDQDQLTWTTDGANAGTVFRRRGKHNCTNVCGTLSPKTSETDLDFCVHAVGHAALFYKRPDTNGAKIMNEEMAAIEFPLPPMEEQILISKEISEISEKFENAYSIKEQQIAALKEYKTSLINAAVTGKIKVA